MRDQHELDAFATTLAEDAPAKAAYRRAMYAGCVPLKHWHIRRDDIKHNVEVFNNKVMPYRRKLRRAYQDGYGLVFTGDNGTGKTLFMGYILGRAVKAGFSVYYTTLKRLDMNIKRGFDDHKAGRRLRACLTADFLAIDELGKEHAKSEFLISELEEILKAKCDDGFPVLLASNLGFDIVGETYGPSISSMLDGKFERVEMEGGDYRQKVNGAMRDKMGYR